jgi:hypothetical protein
MAYAAVSHVGLGGTFLVHCWLSQELLAEVKDHMTSFLPAYKVNEVAVSLWAISRLKGQPGLRLMAAALQHCFSQVGGGKRGGGG